MRFFPEHWSLKITIPYGRSKLPIKMGALLPAPKLCCSDQQKPELHFLSGAGVFRCAWILGCTGIFSCAWIGCFLVVLLRMFLMMFRATRILGRTGVGLHGAGVMSRTRVVLHGARVMARTGVVSGKGGRGRQQHHHTGNSKNFMQ